jgi:hypothetical protein
MPKIWTDMNRKLRAAFIAREIEQRWARFVSVSNLSMPMSRNALDNNRRIAGRIFRA